MPSRGLWDGFPMTHTYAVYLYLARPQVRLSSLRIRRVERTSTRPINTLHVELFAPLRAPAHPLSLSLSLFLDNYKLI